MVDPYTLIALAAAGILVLLFAILLGQARLRERSVRLDTRIADQTLHSEATLKALAETREMLERRLGEDRERIETALSQQREAFDQRQFQALRTMLRTLQTGMGDVRKQVNEALIQNAELVGRRVDSLGAVVDRRLGDIGGHVTSRLAEGFEQTNATFADITARLALIDEAQRRISELSSNVVSLQEILADKRSRGAFGEVQLNALVRNVLPESAYSLQHTLENGTRADCVLFLPSPTGTVVIDAKFPLESFQRMRDDTLGAPARKAAEQRFKIDIRRHIQDISDKYIIPGETSEGALMFIPAEAVFAEIHAHHPQLVELAFRAKVWLASPTTLMAILTTARAVLKDEATRKQAHLIRGHIERLADDFQRFQGRMDKLARHIDLAHRDTQEIHASAQKISAQFQRIEQVEFDDSKV